MLPLISTSRVSHLFLYLSLCQKVYKRTITKESKLNSKGSNLLLRVTSLSGILLKRVAELCLIISSLINCSFTYFKHFSEGNLSNLK